MAFEHPLLQAGFLETLSSRFDCPQVFSVTEETLHQVRRTVYFFMRGSPIQFKFTAIMLVCWDSGELRALSELKAE